MENFKNTDKTVVAKTGVTFMDLLLLANITLKLCGVINWSWWIVLWPLWGGLAFILVLFIILVVVFGIASIIDGIQ